MMKNIITIIALLFMTVRSDAQSILRLINNTDKEVFVAITHKDIENHCWTSEGWLKVPAYSTLDKDFGDYHDMIYVHGYQATMMGLSHKTWGEGYHMCVDPDNAFTIHDADRITCPHKVGFTQRALINGVLKHEFNP